MKQLQLISITAVVLALHVNLVAQADNLPRSTPESQGVYSSKIIDFIKTTDEKVDSMHSFMLLRNGHVVAEAWWKPESRSKQHVLWSLSKSFASTAVGLAVAEKKLNIDDKVIQFFPDDLPSEPSKNLKNMSVRDLLTMTCGHKNEVKLRGKRNWVKSFLAHPVPHEPGTHFKYNTPGTYMLSAIVQEVTGKTVLDYLKPSLFNPLGIRNPKWDSSPQGISIGGYGLFLRTEDIAKFGQLYLQEGKWNGRQLIDSSWVKQSTSKQVSNGKNSLSDWQQGYGYQFWRCRHGAFRGDGKDGQFCIVLPEKNVVIAITANSKDMRGELNLVWEKLLPAFTDKPIEENPKDYRRLKSVISKLEASR